MIDIHVVVGLHWLLTNVIVVAGVLLSLFGWLFGWFVRRSVADLAGWLVGVDSWLMSWLTCWLDGWLIPVAGWPACSWVGAGWPL